MLLISGLILALAENTNRFQNFLKGNKAFTADVYTEIAKTTKTNFIASPLSVQIILALARLGARGKTAQELSTALRIPDNVADIEKTFEEITPRLRKSDAYSLASANKIYVKDGLKLNQNYKDSAVKIFQAEIENINFLNSETISKINAWIAQNTFNKIQDAIAPNSFNKLTQSLLVNTLYFKGSWDHAFNKIQTGLKPFFLSSTEETEATTMQTSDNFKYAINDDLKAEFLEMHYRGSDISMTIVLPHDTDGLSSIESRLSEVFNDQDYYETEVYVQIPKFKTSSTIQFTSILQNLGIKEGFQNSADFTEMGVTPHSLFKISSILQKALIEVDEEGTVAAAATSVMMIRPMVGRIPVNFIANHPFLYFLKSESVGVLFVGRYVNP